MHAEPNIRFPARYSEDDAVARLAWAEYTKHLSDSGIEPSSSPYHEFIHDAFHDSEIRVEIDLGLKARSVDLLLRNVRLLNELQWWHNARNIRREDFLTRITMRACRAISISPDCTQQFWYHCGELSRCESGVALTIATSDRLDGSGAFLDCIGFVADELEVEDITPRLSQAYEIPREQIQEQVASWTVPVEPN